MKKWESPEIATLEIAETAYGVIPALKEGCLTNPIAGIIIGEIIDALTPDCGEHEESGTPDDPENQHS
ncbi:hypothetical protein [Butyrivibrio sp. MC2013]|uniref:hypothetical protein n=1 Tax=Butyrivibrio sp. MC2013 TaxID=1280686 RepID=UPI0004010116|nr:hypothetical protein [Butyrivibrio sp. MC2013]